MISGIQENGCYKSHEIIIIIIIIIREVNQKTQEIFYHYQNFDKVGYKYSTYGNSGFEKGDHRGLMGRYNFRFEKYLGLGFCAAHSIRLPKFLR